MGIFGNKSDHPLADIKSAQELLDGVPKNDALVVVHEVSDWIESLLEQAEEFRLDHELAVLRLFDDAVQPFVRKLLRDYFTVQPPSKFQENRLWIELDRFYTQSELAHYDVLKRYRNGGRGASAIKAELPLLGVRGIAAITGHLKLALARYAMIDPALWRHLADFFSHAESSGYLHDRVAHYPGMAGTTSVQQEFASLLMWYGISAGTQSPLREYLAERLLAYVGDKLEVGSRFSSGGLFVFDLAQPTPPMRASGDSTVHSAVRFLGGGEASSRLSQLLRTFDKGIVPDDMNLAGAKYDPDILGDNTRRLIDGLTQPLPMRRNPRRKINVNLKVANGFYKMLEQTDTGLNFNNEVGDLWEVEDISATGFRSVVTPARADGIKIGSLVGSKPENVAHWGAGIVRRLFRDEMNNMHIGVEVMSPQIIGVLLFDQGYAEQDIRQIAIYLNRPNDSSGEAWLLMRPDTFSPNQTLNMELNGKGYLLMPLALVESGDDYDLARYRKMEQEKDNAA